MTAGTSGMGYVLVSPCLASDAPVAFVTQSDYLSTDGEGSPIVLSLPSGDGAIGTGWSAVMNSGSPYSVNQLITDLGTGNHRAGATSRVAGRILSVGLRLYYNGTTMNLSGTMGCLTTPNHSTVCNTSVSTPVTTDVVLGNPLTEVGPVSRDWCALNLFPVNTAETSYGGGILSSLGESNLTQRVYPFSTGELFADAAGTEVLVTYKIRDPTSGVNLNVGAPVGLVSVSGVVPGTVFQCELITHAEYVGSLASQYGTKSEQDEQGGSMVQLAASELLQRKAARPQEDMWTLMHEALVEAGRAAITYVVPRAVAAVAALI